MIDLEALALIGAGRGKKSAPVQVAYVRDLCEEDLGDLLLPAPLGTSTPSIKSIRAPHHTLARLIADGEAGVKISAITGYSQSRISILQEDPTFRELVEYYKGQKDEIYLDHHKRLAEVGTMALEVLAENLEKEPEEFSNKLLLSIVESTFDRSVAPSKSMSNLGKAALGMPGGVSINIKFADHIPPSDDPKVVEGVEIDLDGNS